MKILHLLDERWDSGITSYAIQIAALLKNAGHEVRLGVLSGKLPERFAKENGIPTAAIDSPFHIYRLLRAQAWDVVNAHTGSTHTWAVLFTPNGIPVIRSRGDARPVQANPLSSWLYKKTAAVIAASEHIAGYYRDALKLDDTKLHVVYPSVPVPTPSAPLSLDRVGILGRLDPVKGHSVFLEAVAEVIKERPQTKFFISGKEANVPYALLENQMRELNIEHAVTYVGFAESAEDFMRECSIGVIASIGSEEISRACLEWMAIGRPVVGTLIGCLPELIEPDETGLLVVPGDGLALGDAVLKILRDSNLAMSWGNNARELIVKKFGADKQLEKTLSIYADVARRAH